LELVNRSPFDEGLATWRASEGTRRLVLYALLAAFAYPVVAVPGSPVLRALAAGLCVALAAVVLIVPRVRPHAYLLQVLNVGALIIVAMALFVERGESALWLGVALLAIFGSQYAFVRRRDLAAVYAAGIVFLFADAAYRASLGDPSHVAMTLMITAAFVVAYVTGSMQIRVQNALLTEVARKTESSHLDPLTGLQTRAVLHERLDAALASARRRKHDVAVLYVDLNRFKLVNDTRGHRAGDQLLVQVGCRLKRVVRTDEIAARVGGDEFVILLPHIERFNEPEEAAARITRALEEPFTFENEHFSVGASIGIARSPYDGFDRESLLASADTNMYGHKRELLQEA
jgi:diguanylate cyclase (GGDEF)-like protein